MRCIACAAEMQLVGSEPDQSMLLSGQELRTFQCLACGRSEQTLEFTRNIEEIAGERMLLPSRSRSGPDIRDTLLKAAQRIWQHAGTALRNAVTALRSRLNL
jgi:hypothetical protein